MALEDILDAIRSEAEEEAARIVSEASSRADRLAEDARARADEREDQLAHSVDERVRSERRRTVSLAVLAASRARRAAREEIFQRVVEGVAGRLRGLHEEPRYEQVLTTLTDEALAVLPGPTSAMADPRDVGLVRRVLAERGLDIPVAPVEDSWGGISLVSDGRIVRNDLRSRLERSEHHLRFIAGEVFPALRGGET